MGVDRNLRRLLLTLTQGPAWSISDRDSGNPGADQVAASFVDGATTVPSNPAVKLWDGDCNHNHIADTCDTSCTGFGGACAKVVMCAMRTDFDSDGVPDECKCTYAGSTAARVSNDSTSSANLLANAPGGLAKLARNVVFTDGTTVTGSEVRLANGANAFDVHGDARLARRATVRHATGPATLPLVDPFCPVTPITCGGADLDVPTGGHADLAAGDHGAVTLRNDASLTLAAGTHTFCSLRTGRRAKIDVAAGVQTVLDVAGDLRLQNGTRFRAAASAPPPIVNVAGAEIRIGPQSEVEARIAGGAAAASVGREARVAGGLCAATFRTGRKVKLACSLP